LEDHWLQLCHRFTEGQLPHALLIAGQRGIGKTELAESFAQFVLCRSSRSSTDATKTTAEQKTSLSLNQSCGECHSCALIRAGTHPDLIYLIPEEKGKAIKIDQVRDLIEYSSKTSQIGGYKVVIINPADALNINAANALLKCLEEPAANTLILLVTDGPQSLMATIRSRCQIIRIPIPKRDISHQWLQANPQIGNLSVAEQIALLDLAGDQPLTALGYIESDAIEQHKMVLQSFVELSQKKRSPITVAAQWSKLDALEIVNWLYLWLKAVAIDAAQPRTSDQPLNSAIEILSQSLQHYPGYGPAQLHEFINEIILTKRKILSPANANRQMLFEELLIKWQQMLEQT
jgi:DNA polymerase-3 subunit delta'